MAFWDFLGGDDDESEPTTIEDDDKIAAEQRFQQQCYLTSHWDRFRGANKGHLYPNLAVIDGEPSVIINELTKRPGVDALFGVKPYQLSLLVPTLRLFKVEYPTEGDKVGEDLELKFDSHLSRDQIDSITKNRMGRGSGVGIKSFEWEYLGKNPAEAETNIKAHLSIFFQNVEDLVGENAAIRQPGGTAVGEANFTDLFVRSSYHEQAKKGENGEADCEGGRSYNPKRFRIKAIVGWAMPPKNDLISPDLRLVLGSMQTVLMLDLVKHSLEFNEDGTLGLKAEYVGSVENSLNHHSSDILNIGAEQKKEEEEAAAKANCRKDQKVEDPPETDEDKEDKEEKLEEAKKAKTADRGKKYARLLQKLKDTERIFYIDIPKAALGATDDGDQQTRKESAKKADDPAPETPGESEEPQQATTTEPIDAALEEAADEDATAESVVEAVSDIQTEAESPLDASKLRVNFMYYGDIINTVVSILDYKTNPAPVNTRILMGPITFYDNRRKAKQKQMFNLADVPISLDLFTAWWTEKVIKTGGRDNYFLKDFIRDTIKELIAASIDGGCSVANEKQNNIIGINIVPSRGKGEKGAEPRIETNTRVKVADIAEAGGVPLPAGEGRKTNVGLHHYIFIYSSSEPADMFTGDKAEDLRRGIYHLGIGEEQGILKSIKFSQVSQKFLKEANYARDGAGTAFFRERYNANVELIGNVLFYPGSQVYINPSITGLGSPSSRNSFVENLGIGGYYQISEVSNTIDDSGFQTSIKCIWTNKGQGLEKTPSASDDDGGILGGIGDAIGIGGGKDADAPGGGLSLPGLG